MSAPKRRIRLTLLIDGSLGLINPTQREESFATLSLSILRLLIHYHHNLDTKFEWTWRIFHSVGNNLEYSTDIRLGWVLGGISDSDAVDRILRDVRTLAQSGGKQTQTPAIRSLLGSVAYVESTPAQVVLRQLSYVHHQWSREEAARVDLAVRYEYHCILLCPCYYSAQTGEVSFVSQHPLSAEWRYFVFGEQINSGHTPLDDESLLRRWYTDSQPIRNMLQAANIGLMWVDTLFVRGATPVPITRDMGLCPVVLLSAVLQRPQLAVPSVPFPIGSHRPSCGMSNCIANTLAATDSSGCTIDSLRVVSPYIANQPPTSVSLAGALPCIRTAALPVVSEGSIRRFITIGRTPPAGEVLRHRMAEQYRALVATQRRATEDDAALQTDSDDDNRASAHHGTCDDDSALRRQYEDYLASTAEPWPSLRAVHTIADAAASPERLWAVLVKPLSALRKAYATQPAAGHHKGRKAREYQLQALLRLEWMKRHRLPACSDVQTADYEAVVKQVVQLISGVATKLVAERAFSPLFDLIADGYAAVIPSAVRQLFDEFEIEGPSFLYDNESTSDAEDNSLAAVRGPTSQARSTCDCVVAQTTASSNTTATSTQPSSIPPSLQNPLLPRRLPLATNPFNAALRNLRRTFRQVEMEDNDAALFADLRSTHAEKQIDALTRLYQLLITLPNAVSRDVTAIFVTLSNHSLKLASRPVRLLAYHCLRVLASSAPNLVEREWTDACRAIMEDFYSVDEYELRIAALKAICHLPVSSLLDLFGAPSRKLDFQENFSHLHRAVRRAAVDTASVLCIQRPDVLLAAHHNSSLQDQLLRLWTLVCEKATGDADNDVTSASFNALRALFSIAHDDFALRVDSSTTPHGGPSLLELACDSSISPTLLIQPYVDHVLSALAGGGGPAMFASALRQRFAKLDMPRKPPGVFVLACVALSATDPALKGLPAPWTHCRSVVYGVIREHLLPPLVGGAAGEPSLAYECVRAILWLQLHARVGYHPSFVFQCVAVLQSLLDREGLSDTSVLSLLVPLVFALRLINPFYVMPFALRALAAAERVTEGKQRLRVLSDIFDVLLRSNASLRHAVVPRSDGLSREHSVASLKVGSSVAALNLLKALLENDWIIAIMKNADSSFREEFLRCLIDRCCVRLMAKGSTTNSSSPTPQPAASDEVFLEEVLYLAEVGCHCLTWNCKTRTIAAEAYVRLVDTLCTAIMQRPFDGTDDQQRALRGRCEELLGRIADVISGGTIPEAIAVRGLLLCSKHLPPHLLSLVVTGSHATRLLDTIATRFLRLDLVNANKELLRQVGRDGTLGSGAASREIPKPKELEAVLQGMLLLAARSPDHELEPRVRRYLEAAIDLHHSDPLFVARCRHYRKRLDAITGRLPTSELDPLDRHAGKFLSVPEEVPALPSLSEVPLESGTHPNERFFINYKLALQPHSWAPLPNSTRPVVLTGPSDPFTVEGSCHGNASLSRVTVHVKLTNSTTSKAEHLVATIGVGGGLIGDVNHASHKLHYIQALAPAESAYWSAPFTVSGFDMLRFHLQIHILAGGPADSSGGRGPPLGGHSVYTKNARIINCIPLMFDAANMLHPVEFSPEEFVAAWGRCPASFIRHVSIRTGLWAVTEPSAPALVQKANGSVDVALLTQFAAAVEEELHVARVRNWVYGTEGQCYFQMAFSGFSWFNSYVLFTISGSSDHSGAGSDEKHRQQLVARIEFRASSLAALQVCERNLPLWIKNLFGPSGHYILALLDADAQSGKSSYPHHFDITDPSDNNCPAVSNNHVRNIISQWRQLLAARSM